MFKEGRKKPFFYQQHPENVEIVIHKNSFRNIPIDLRKHINMKQFLVKKNVTNYNN